MNKKIISVILVLALCLTNMGVATFAASMVHFANYNVGVESNNETLVGKYHEKYKMSQTMLLMNDNNETTEEQKEETTLNEDLLNDKSEAFDEVDTDETKDIDLEEDLETEDLETEAEETEAEETEAEETEAEQTEVEAEETVAEDATEVSDEEKETEVETEAEAETEIEVETETTVEETTVEETTVEETEELSVDIATNSKAKEELELFGADMHYHKACGASNNQSCNHPGIGNHTTLITYAIFDDDVVTGGNYYLTGDKTISDEITLDREMHICLNGYNLTIPKFNLSEYKISITDCQENVGSISSTSDNILLYGGNADIIYTKNDNQRLLVKADTAFDSSLSDEITTSINAYGVKFSPVSTSVKSLVGVRGSNINLYKTTFTGFNIKDENIVTTRKATYVKDCTFTGNTVANAIFRLNDDVTLTFEGDNLVTDNTSGCFIRSMAENSTIGMVTLNDNVDIIDNKFCQVLSIRYGDTLNINGNLNVKGNKTVTTINGVSVSGTPVTIVAFNSATVNINKNANVFIGKNDSGTNAELTTVMIANGTDTAEGAKKASINVYGTLEINGVVASENICYILNGGTFNMENNISLSNISYGGHGFTSSATAGGYNFKSGVLDISNLTRTGSLSSSSIFYISCNVYFNASLNIKSSSVHNVFRIGGGSEVIINGDVNIGGAGVGNTIGNDVFFLYGAPSTLTINGNFNIESNTITRYIAILYDRGYETNPIAPLNNEDNYSSMILSEKSTFTFKNNVAQLNNVTSVRGNISVLGNYNRFISKGAFNVVDNTLGHTIDQPFITVAYGTNMFDGAYAEFSGVTTFEENTSNSFFAYSGSDGTATEWTVFRFFNKFIIKNNKLHQNNVNIDKSGFVNASQKVEWSADTVIEGNEMVRFFWHRKEVGNTIENPVTLTNNKFYREFVKTEGDLTVNGNINATGNTFGQGFIIAKSSLIVNSNINLADSTVKKFDVATDEGIPEAGSLIYVYNGFTINNGKQLNINSTTIYRRADRSQSVIRLDSKDSDLNMSNSGSMTIYDTTLVCDVDGVTEKTNVAGIYANAGLLMKLGNGTFKIASLSEIGDYANSSIENHLFGIFAENIEGFITQISGTKFNTNNNRIEKVAFNTADQQGVVFIGWGTAVTNPSAFENNWTADETFAPAGIDLVLQYRASDGNLWISDGSEVHAHKICGLAEDEQCSTHGEGFNTTNHETITYGRLSNATITKFLNDNKYEMSGRYYLEEDLNIDASKDIMITDDLYICLNGFTLGVVKFNSDGSGQVFVTNCKNESATIVGRTGTVTLFEKCYPTVIAGKGTINLNANSIWFINNTSDRKDVNLYNVKCEPNQTESSGRHMFFVESGAGVPTITVSSASFTNYNIAGSAVRIYTEANAYFYDCSWKNINNSGAYTMFGTNKDGNATFKNCIFENITSSNSNNNVDIFTINANNTKTSTYTMINCSVKGISITGTGQNHLFNAVSTGQFIIENTTIENAQTAYNAFRLQQPGQLILNNVTVANCVAKNDFINVAGDGSIVNTKGTVTFDNNTATNNSFYACSGVSPQWINEGTLNITNNNIKQEMFYLGGTSGSGKFYSEDDNSVLNITGNTISKQDSNQNMWCIEAADQGLHLGGVVNVNNNILTNTNEGHYILRITKEADLKFTGKISMNNNVNSYRLVAISGVNLDIDCEELNLIANTLNRKQNKSQYLIAIDGSGCQVNLKNTNLTMTDNVLDCTTKAASSDTNWAAVIGINSSDHKGILVGNGNIIIKDNTEVDSDNIWQNKFYGFVSYEIGGALKQIEGTTIGANSYVEKVGFKSIDGCGIIISGTTKDVSSMFNLDTTKFPSAGLHTLYQDNNVYVVGNDGLHAHKDCGAGVNEVCSHEGVDAHTEATIYSKFMQGDALPVYGYIYLGEDINMNIAGNTTTLTKDLHICLNGHTISFTRSSDIAVFALVDYSLYITNCKDVEGSIVTDSRKKEFATVGALKAMSSKGTINIKTDYLLYAGSGTKDSVELYNVALSMAKTNGSLSWSGAGVINTKASNNDVIISSVSITGYKLDDSDISSKQNTRFLNHDQTANKVNIYLYDVKINNCISGSTEDFMVAGNNQGEFIVRNLSVNSSDFGKHCLIAVRANTKLQIEGVNTVKNTTTSFTGDSSAYCFYLSAETSAIDLNGDFILENITYNTTSAYIVSVRTGTFTINGNLYLKNPNWTVTNQACLVSMSTGKTILNEGATIRVEGNVDESGAPISVIRSNADDSGFIKHTGSSGGLTINGDIYIKNIDMSGLSYLFYTSTQPDMSGGKFYVENVKVGKGILDIHAGCEINKEIKIDNCEVGENILYADGDVVFKDTIEMTNNKTANNIALINGNVEFAENEKVVIENNEMVRKADTTQGIFNIIKTGVTINSLGSITIRNNTLINDIKATERTFAAAIRIPNESKFIMGKDPIIVKDNTTTGDNADAALGGDDNFPENNHLFGIMSDNVKGFMETAGTFNVNSYLENVIFTSEDGFGQIFAKWTGGVPNYITADKTITQDVKIAVEQGALWVKDSNPLHYHTTCGIYADDHTTCTKAHTDMDITHENVLYSLLRAGKSLPTFGNVYLSSDYTITDAEFQLTGDLYICLNGYNLNATRFNLKYNDVNYNIYISNCSDNKVTIDTAAATKNSDFVFNHGGLQIMSVKGAITVKADIILNVDTETETGACDLMLYNVAFEQKSNTVSYNGTRIDYKPKNHSAYIASVSFTKYKLTNNNQATFYYSNNDVNVYFNNVRFEDILLHNPLRFASTGSLEINNSTFKNFSFKGYRLFNIDNNAKAVKFTNTTFDNITIPSGASENSALIHVERANVEVILDNVTLKDIDFSAPSSNNTIILRHNAQQTAQISNVTATNIKAAVFTNMNTSSVEINGDLLIKDSTFTGNVFELNQATVTGNGNVTVEDTTLGTGNVFSNASGTNGNVNIGGDVKIKNVSINQGNFVYLTGTDRAFNVSGNFDIESSTITTGDAIKTDNDTASLSIGKNFTTKNITLTNGVVVYVDKGSSFNVGGDLVFDGNVLVAEKAVMISRVKTVIGGNLIAKNIVTRKNIMDVGKNTMTIDKDLIYDNIQTGGASLVVQANGLLTINGKFTVQNSLTTESILWTGENGVLDLNGESYFYNNTINYYIMKPQADFVVKKNMTIASNSFLAMGIDAYGNIDIKDGAKLLITKNTIYRHGNVGTEANVPGVGDIPSINVDPTLNSEYIHDLIGNQGNDNASFIKLNGDGKLLELNNTGSFEVTENKLIAYWKNAEYDLPDNTYFAFVGLNSATNAINVGNGVFKIANNTFDFGNNPEGMRETTLFNIYSKNVNNVINQNDGTKFNTSSNYVGIVGFDDGGELTEGTIYPDWNADNVANYTADAHLRIFDNTILNAEQKYFGLSLIENNVVLKQANHSHHYVCGASSENAHTHTNANDLFKHKTTDEAEIAYVPLLNKEDIMNGGDYFLISDLVFSTLTTVKPSSKLRLCLNGFSINNVLFRFDATDYDVIDENDKSVIICNCSEVTSVIENSSANDLFDNMILFGRRIENNYDNLQIRSNKVANGKVITAVNTSFTQYNDTAADYVFNYVDAEDSIKENGRGIQNSSIAEYHNKASIFKGGEVEVYDVRIVANDNASYIFNNTDVTLKTVQIFENTNIKESFIKATNLYVLPEDANNLTSVDISDNEVVRQNKQQTLIDVSGEIQYSTEFSITGNLVISNADTAKTNILSTFNLSANQTLQYGEGGYIILEDNVTSGTKEETNGNHLYNIYTKNPDKIFESIAGAAIKFNAVNTFVEGYAFGTADNTGIVIRNWNSEGVTGELKNYNDTFLLDTYLNDELAVKYDKVNEYIIVYKVQPFYVVYENGSLEASDGKTYTPSGKVEEEKYAPIYDVDDEEEKYYITLKDNPLKLTGAYLNGTWEDKEHNLYNYSDNDLEVTDLIESDAKGRHVVVFRASWSELWYDVVLDLNGGALAEDESVTGEYTMNMKYYETKEVPVATKSGMVFVDYAYQLTLNAEEVEGFEPLYQPGDAIGPKLTLLKEGSKLYQNFGAFYGAEVHYLAEYVDPNAEVVVTFKANGGSGNMSAVSISYLNGANLPNNKFTRSGYSFTGWSTTQTGAVVYKNGERLSSDNVPVSAVDEGLILYAVWKKDSSGGGSRGSGSSGGSGSASPYIGPMGDLTKNPLYANLNSIQNKIPQEKLVNNEVLANALLNSLTNVHSELTLARDGSGNTGAGKWLKMDNTDNWYFFIGDTAQNGSFITNGWFNIGWAGQDRWYHFDSLGSMQTGWFMDKDGKLYYLLADKGSTFYGSIVTGIQIIDNKIYIFDENGALILQYS